MEINTEINQKGINLEDVRFKKINERKKNNENMIK